jgi:SAM-dependent methyltransferase
MTASSDGVDYHRHYFSGKGRASRIALGLTPTVRRHYARTIGPLGLGPGARVLELGCGLGRFTELLLADGFDVTALDLSADLVASLQSALGGAGRLTTVAGRAEDLATLVSAGFDAVVGFFFLHHLPVLEPGLAAARSVLAPGGQIAFCEPNAYNPLIYVQVTFTPGMRWRGEPSIPKMRPSLVFPILAGLGLVDLRTDLYGALPPFMSNKPVGARVERAVEAIAPLRPLSAYRILAGRLPPAS